MLRWSGRIARRHVWMGLCLFWLLQGDWTVTSSARCALSLSQAHAAHAQLLQHSAAQRQCDSARPLFAPASEISTQLGRHYVISLFERERENPRGPG
jgi:hypothetical protein